MTPRDIAILVLSAIIVFGFGRVLIAWIIYPPQTHSDLMSAMIATLGAGYLQVINYWFSKPKEPQ
jgi:hypothetical protein